MKKNLLVFVSLLLVFVMSACGGNAGAPASSEGSEDVIKIGGIYSASGGAAPLGKAELDTVEMLAEQINSNGGINGKKIDLITYDSKSSQNEAVLSMKRLVEQDKVIAVLGGTTSGNTLAMIPQAQKSEVPFISQAASKQINKPDDGSSRKWIFKTAQGDDVAVPRVVAYLKNEGITKVAWLNVANSFGTSGHEEFNRLAEEEGLEVVAEEEFEATVNDAKAMLTRVKKENPEAVIVWGTAQESAVVTKNIRELGMDVPIIASHGIGTKQFIELAGNAANGVLFPSSRILVADQLSDDDPQKEVVQAYQKQFEEEYGYPASSFGGYAYDAFHMLIQAIEEVGTDKAAIRDALENTKDFVGISGIFNMSPEDHNGLGKDALVMIEIKDGEWKIKE